MLFFELFPAFVALVSLGVGIALYVRERRARARGIEDHRPVGSRPTVTAAEAENRSHGSRPSMRG